jgi:hypothetical protein
MTIDNIEPSRVIVSYDDPFDSKSSHCNALHVTIQIRTGIFLAGEVCSFGADVVPSHGPLRLEAVSMGDTGSHHGIKCFPIIPIRLHRLPSFGSSLSVKYVRSLERQHFYSLHQYEDGQLARPRSDRELERGVRRYHLCHTGFIRVRFSCILQ